jgi:hypothetical protein
VANEYTKCGEGVCLEIAKTNAIGVSLECLIGESYDSAVYRLVKGVFSGGIRLEIRSGVSEVHS